MLQDLRFALRLLWKKPAFSAVAIVALAVGIGSATAVFSVLDGLLLRPLPYPDAERLVVLGETTWKDRAALDAVAPANFLDWKAQTRVFSHLAAYRTWHANLTTGDRPERVRTATVSGDFFGLVGSKPLLGRVIGQQDEQPGRADVAVISYRLWQDRFGGERQALGRTLELDGRPHTIVGVMPRGFSFSEEGVDAWLPSPWDVPPHPVTGVDPRTLRDVHYLDVFGRLESGVTFSRAMADLDAVARRIEAANPATNRDHAIGMIPLRESVAGHVRPTVLLLAAAVALVLLIACANVANLLLARASERTAEMSLRMALGATRARLAQQVVVESVLLSAIGGGLGVLVASWGSSGLLALAPASLPDFVDASIDGRVLAFALIVSVATGMLFGLLPALQVSGLSLGGSLKEGGRETLLAPGPARMRAGLVGVEMALSLVLLVGAGLLARSFARLMDVQPGFDPRGVLVFSVAPSTPDVTRGTRFFAQVIDRIQAMPGVRSAGAISRLPLVPGNSSRSVGIIGEQRDDEADYRVVGGDYFRSMGIPLRSGRTFTASDDEHRARVVIVNEALARRLFPGRDAVGRALDFGGPTLIVGVVGGVRHEGLDVSPRPEFYVPIAQAWWPTMYVTVRSATSDPAALLPAVQHAVWSVDKDVPLGDVRTMDQVVGRSVARRQFAMVLLALFAATALLLAAIGLYADVAYSVARRTREFGVRMALGARPAAVLRMVLGESLRVTIGGTVVGLVAAFGLVRLLSGLLFSVSTWDPLVFGAVPLILAAVAQLACYLPARRATKIDPIAALRHE